MKRSIVLLLIVSLCFVISACDNNPVAVAKNQTDMGKPRDQLCVGDSVAFGSYEQDNLLDNGKEVILWDVVEIDDDYALLVSKSIITSYQYHVNEKSVTWEDSILRAWLNSRFFETAFSSSERTAIMETDLHTPSIHQKYYSSILGSYTYTVDALPSCWTADKVFILSVDEIDKYYSTDTKRLAKPTVSVQLEAEDAFEWWTRTPGVVVGSQKIVDDNGSHDLGGAINTLEIGVRPAVWVKLDSEAILKQ